MNLIWIKHPFAGRALDEKTEKDVMAYIEEMIKKGYVPVGLVIGLEKWLWEDVPTRGADLVGGGVS